MVEYFFGDCHIVHIKTESEKAQIVFNAKKDGIIVACATDAIKLITIKPEGKGEMQASAWGNGARIQKGAKFI